LHLLGSLREPEGGKGFGPVERLGTAVDEKRRLGVAAERVLEEERERRVSEGDVFARRVRQGVDDVAQSGQRLVDLLGLLQRLTRGVCLGCSRGWLKFFFFLLCYCFLLLFYFIFIILLLLVFFSLFIWSARVFFH